MIVKDKGIVLEKHISDTLSSNLLLGVTNLIRQSATSLEIEIMYTS